MGVISTDQIKEINNKCSNGWRLDTQYHIMHNEKRLYKCIELDEENYLEFSISYNSNKQITLHISKFYHENGKPYASSNGLGKTKILEAKPSARKNIKQLIECTSKLTNEKLMEINKDTPVAKGYGLILQSEDF